MNRFGVTLTSLGMAFIMGLSGDVSLIKASAAENYDNSGYRIYYIHDESAITMEDHYDENLINQYRMASDDTIVDIPNIYKYTVASAVGKDEDDPITVGDLRSITKFTLIDRHDVDVDLGWLNYLENLKEATLYGESIMRNADDILAFPNLKSISFGTTIQDSFDARHIAFLRHCPKLEFVSFDGASIEGLEQLDGYVREMEISVYNNTNVDFRKLDFLDKLTIYGDLYNVAITLSNDDINYLESMGVELSFEGGLHSYTRDDLKKVNDRLDSIVDSLDVDVNSTDEEKINAILVYILSNCEYDPEVSRQIREGLTVIDSEFGKKGSLYGSLEMDTQICINYAALFTALYHRLGGKVFTIDSDRFKGNHAWNLAVVDGECYYYDATMLDKEEALLDYKDRNDLDDDEVIFMHTEDIITERPELLYQVEWYKTPINIYDKAGSDFIYGPKDIHDPINLPFSIVEVKEELPGYGGVSNSENSINTTSSDNVSKSNTSNKKTSLYDIDTNFSKRLFNITIGNKTFRKVSGAMVMGIMSALGLAYAVGKVTSIDRKKNNKDIDLTRLFENASKNALIDKDNQSLGMNY